MFIIELERGVWIAEGDGDPARTTQKRNAKTFQTLKESAEALTAARQHRPFTRAEIECIKSVQDESVLVRAGNPGGAVSARGAK